MKIRKSVKKDVNAVKKIVKDLHPTWFDKNALKNIPIDFLIQNGFVAVEKGKVVGFVTYTSKNGSPELSWIGIYRKLHGKGVGKKLVKTLENELKKCGAKSVHVETVGWCRPVSKAYAATVKFYKAVGFSEEKKSKTTKHGKYRYRMYTFKKVLK